MTKERPKLDWDKIIESKLDELWDSAVITSKMRQPTDFDYGVTPETRFFNWLTPEILLTVSILKLIKVLETK